MDYSSHTTEAPAGSSDLKAKIEPKASDLWTQERDAEGSALARLTLTCGAQRGPVGSQQHWEVTAPTERGAELHSCQHNVHQRLWNKHSLSPAALSHTEHKQTPPHPLHMHAHTALAILHQHLSLETPQPMSPAHFRVIMMHLIQGNILKQHS